MSVGRKLWIFLLTIWFLLIIIMVLRQSSRYPTDDVQRHPAQLPPNGPESKIPAEEVVKAGPVARTESKYILFRQARQITREIRRLAKSQLSGSGVAASEKLSSEDLLDWFSKMSLLLETKLSGASRVDGQAEELVAQLDALARTVQERILSLQNPPDCQKARYLTTTTEKACGFGCRVHHWVYCFSVAFALNRTLYMSEGPNHSEFLPVTSCVPRRTRAESFSTGNSNSQSLHCPIIDMMNSNLLPPALPADLATALEQLHGAPFPWFAGQLLQYLFRLKEGEFKRALEGNLSSLRTEAPHGGYRQPVVGIHVRRTDKVGTEAQFHKLSEYMLHAERFFQMKELERQIANAENHWTGDLHAPVSKSASLKRRVYLATDDPSVFADAEKQYPEYEFIGDRSRADSASVDKRGSRTSLQGIITDVIMLANTDFLSCTFSSQVCRLAYELMQTQHRYLGDASGQFESLDDLYYFGGQQMSPWKAIMSDAKRDIRLGEEYSILGNHWDGFAKAERIGAGNKGPRMLPAFLFDQQVVRLPNAP
ncbi:Alpha-(1,6)-fucosyltransferase [Sparganum proliferum]